MLNRNFFCISSFSMNQICINNIQFIIHAHGQNTKKKVESERTNWINCEKVKKTDRIWFELYATYLLNGMSKTFINNSTRDWNVLTARYSFLLTFFLLCGSSRRIIKEHFFCAFHFLLLFMSKRGKMEECDTSSSVLLLLLLAWWQQK